MPRPDGKPTKGELRIRPDVNTGQLYEVNMIKQACVQHIDDLDALLDEGGEVARCAALAQSRFEEAAMWATKAYFSREEATRPDPVIVDPVPRGKP